MNESVNVKYITSNEHDSQWGVTITTVGHQQIKPHTPYPSTNHPFLYLFSPERGRVLDEYQLIYILNGKGTFQSASKKRVEIKSGQMIMLFPGEWHSYMPDDETGWYEHWIGYKGAHMDALVTHGFFCKEEPIFNIGMNEEIIRLYKLAANIAARQNTGFQQVLAGIVQLFLGYTYSENRKMSFDNMNVSNQIITAKQIIAENFNNDIRPEEIAGRVNLSYSWFRTIFKQYTGFSPLRYKEELRIQKSKELLANTSMTSQQIAFEVGYNNPYYFCILFKQRTGHTPLEYRAIAQGLNL